MGSSGFPIDLVLFAMIAGFLVLRLRSILGRRTGFERPPQPYQPQAGQGPVIDGVAAAVKQAEALVSLGLSTSKRGSYASPLPKSFIGAMSGFAPIPERP